MATLSPEDIKNISQYLVTHHREEIQGPMGRDGKNGTDGMGNLARQHLSQLRVNAVTMQTEIHNLKTELNNVKTELSIAKGEMPNSGGIKQHKGF